MKDGHGASTYRWYQPHPVAGTASAQDLLLPEVSDEGFGGCMVIRYRHLGFLRKEGQNFMNISRELIIKGSQKVMHACLF